MLYIYNYSIFENIQQAEKILKDNNINRLDFKILFDEFKKNGLSAYLGYCMAIIKNSYFFYDRGEGFFQADLNQLIEIFKKIRDNKINTETLKDDMNIEDLKVFVDDSIRRKLLISFINKWCPSKIRNEVKEKINNYKFFYYDRYFYNIKNLSDIKIKMLKNGSRYKTGEEWIKFLQIVLEDGNYSLEDLKNSNIDIKYEDDEYLIYKPLDYESYMIPRFEFWCTIHSTMYDRYSKLNLLVVLNKKDKKDSYLVYSSYKGTMVFGYKNDEINLNMLEDKIKNFLEKYYSN